VQEAPFPARGVIHHGRSEHILSLQYRQNLIWQTPRTGPLPNIRCESLVLAKECVRIHGLIRYSKGLSELLAECHPWDAQPRSSAFLGFLKVRVEKTWRQHAKPALFSQTFQMQSTYRGRTHFTALDQMDNIGNLLWQSNEGSSLEHHVLLHSSFCRAVC
jgi:hypothetical protein